MWIGLIMELRDPDDIQNIISTRCCLLQRDGDVVASDGISRVDFENIAAGQYYITIKHRNHLGVITENTHYLSDAPTSLDFTSDLQLTKGGLNGIAQLSDGVFGLFSGDADFNNQVQNVDQSLTILSIGTNGYLQNDLDLNSQIQNTDLQLKLIPNIGKGAQY